jgi:hypothetical protein
MNKAKAAPRFSPSPHFVQLLVLQMPMAIARLPADLRV